MVQSDVIGGAFCVAVGEDLTGYEGKLARLAGAAGTGAARVKKLADPPAFGPLYVVADTDGVNASVLPLSPGYAVRIALTGVCAVGDALFVNADGSVSAAETPAAGAVCAGFAEEPGVDGQAVRVRPCLCQWQAAGE
jgi:hypothetical protein